MKKKKGMRGRGRTEGERGGGEWADEGSLRR